MNLEALAKRLEKVGIAPYELDDGVGREAAAALRDCLAVLRECERIVVFDGPTHKRIRALIGET